MAYIRQDGARACCMRIYAVEEMLGTKLRALYQRKKGRDLFDLDYALTHITASPERVLPCFCRYMLSTSGSIPTQKEFLLNMEEKMHSPDFLSDTRPILLPSIPFDPQTAYTRLCDTLFSQLDTYRR